MLFYSFNIKEDGVAQARSAFQSVAVAGLKCCTTGHRYVRARQISLLLISEIWNKRIQLDFNFPRFKSEFQKQSVSFLYTVQLLSSERRENALYLIVRPDLRIDEFAIYSAF